MPAYKYWRKIGLEHEIADISLQLEGQGESLKQNKRLKGQSLKYIAENIFFQRLKNIQLMIWSVTYTVSSVHSVFQPKLIMEVIIIRMINSWCVTW
jgi:hypothetical protein